MLRAQQLIGDILDQHHIGCLNDFKQSATPSLPLDSISLFGTYLLSLSSLFSSLLADIVFYVPSLNIATAADVLLFDVFPVLCSIA